MAEDEVKMRKERDPILMVCFVVFLLASCAIIGSSVYNNYLKADDTMAVSGSSVTVNYTGSYYAYYGEEYYVVFDTSRWSVADNDDAPKSNDFELRDEKNYTELKFTVGGTDVLAGFGNAVIGHKVGDKIKVVVPSGEGYIAPATEQIVTASQVFTVSSTEKLTSAQFKELYGYDLRGYEVIEKSVYGWPATASYNNNDDTITMTYSPVANQTYEMVDSEYGKVSAKVSSVGNNISYTMVVSDYTVVSTDSEGNKEIQMIMVNLGTEKHYVKSVVDADNDGTPESFVWKTAGEKFNQDLYFEIEIISIN